jgi:hypothetical protein
MTPIAISAAGPPGIARIPSRMRALLRNAGRSPCRSRAPWLTSRPVSSRNSTGPCERRQASRQPLSAAGTSHTSTRDSADNQCRPGTNPATWRRGSLAPRRRPSSSRSESAPLPVGLCCIPGMQHYALGLLDLARRSSQRRGVRFCHRGGGAGLTPLDGRPVPLLKSSHASADRVHDFPV